MPNKTCQVRMNEDTYIYFMNLYDKRKRNNPGYTKVALMDEIVKDVYMRELNFNEKDVDIFNALNKQQQLLNKIYEYVALLTKGSNTLPVNMKEMEKYVNKPSRFEKVISKKLGGEDIE
ncbi:MAG: hypothetical protein LUG60_00925 [Erysipelotrichaceae bacterium]|nr:hypothetical protein [Erysipelotrichaceae bacterium]